MTDYSTLAYGEQIEQVFKSLDMTAQSETHQAEVINEILTAFYDLNKPVVVLCAPTGVGKSIIGAVVAGVINMIEGSKIASSILMHNNALVSQYHKTFADFGEDRYLQIKGAANYPCTAMSTPEEPATADTCVFQMLQREQMHNVIGQHCKKCEHKRVRQLVNETKNLITNFSYQFFDRLVMQRLEHRDITIWDEGHKLNDAYCSHVQFGFSEDSLKKLYQEVTEHLTMSDVTTSATIRKLVKQLHENGVDASNYKHFVAEMLTVYENISSVAYENAENPGLDVKRKLKLTRLAQKYGLMTMKLSDFVIKGFEHVFDLKEEIIKETGKKEYGFEIKPIFVGDDFELMLNSKFTLFMSATITPTEVQQTLKIPASDMQFIKAPAVFPPENKRVVFYKPLPMNRAKMVEPNFVETINERIGEIIIQHAVENQENGLILTPSFDVTQKVVSYLEDCFTGLIKIFAQVRGKKAEKVVADFMKYECKPNETKLLISPSIYEGVDLRDDLSRFQIIIKAPFPSLGDKRVAYIANNYPDVFNTGIIQTMVQGCGRSVRSMTDHAITYMLDSNAERLWNSQLNVWRDEFQTIKIR